MNRRVKLAILALLGFSTACSTVKDSPRRDGKACGSDEAPAPDSVERKIPPRIVLMYGVRPPHPVQSVPRQDGGSAAPADSAAERPYRLFRRNPPNPLNPRREDGDDARTPYRAA